MTFDEAIKLLDKLADGVDESDSGLDEYYLKCRACEMGSLALTRMIEEHDRISGMLRHYNEIDEGHDD